MTEQETVKQIHAAFAYKLTGDVFPGAFPQVKNYLDFSRQCPPGMSTMQFAELVRYYAHTYPQNNFVTEHQLKQICTRYGLVTGPQIAFSEQIPERNQAEINAFRLVKTDGVWETDGDTRRAFYDGLRQTEFSMQESTGGTNPYTLKAGPTLNATISQYVQMEILRDKQPLPIGESLVVIRNPAQWQSFELYAKIQVYNSEWLLKVASLQHGAFEMRFGYGFDVELTLRLYNNELQALNRFSLADVQRQIVAPPTMFQNFPQSMEEKDGYVCRFRDANPTGNHLDPFGPNDPIVLQPVPGGYLVLTMYGPEENISEMQNTRRN